MQLNMESLTLANMPGLEADFQHALAEITRVFEEPDAYQDKKMVLTCKVNLELTVAFDTVTGNAVISKQTTVKRPGGRTESRMVHMRSGVFWVEPQHPDQAALPFPRPAEGDDTNNP